MRKSLMGSAMPFAHLLGFGPKSAASRASDDDDMEGDDDEEKAAVDDDDDADEKKESKKARRAEGDDDDNKASGDDDGDEEKKTSKKSRRADDDDDNDNDKKDARSASSARKAERARWTKVLAHKAAGEGRVGMAVQMLSTTDLSASQIVGTLAAAPTAAPTKTSGLYDRMASTRQPHVGADGGQASSGGANKHQAAADFILASRSKAAGK